MQSILTALLALPFTLSLNLSPRSQVPLGPLDHSQDYQFDPLLHLPGISPYFDAVGFGLDHKAPFGCNVTAASYLVRHAAIYANDDDYETYIQPLLYKIELHRGSFAGALSFLNDWHTSILDDHLEDITPSGRIDARKVGAHLLQRYPHLVPSTKRILADKKPRTYDTAQAFVDAFPHKDEIEIVRFLKNAVNHSLDVLTPHKSCAAFSKEPGKAEMAEFVDTYAPSVVARLDGDVPPAFNMSANEVFGMQMLCGYESAINGAVNDFCAVFTDAEWMAFEYALDMWYAHIVGVLNPLSPYLGLPWVKAQYEIFAQMDRHKDRDQDDLEANMDLENGWPVGQKLFLSFTHREVPPFVVTVLGLFNSSSNATEQFPTDHINWTRAWKMADLIPFLGHVGMEKMQCDLPGFESDFVRFIANSAPRPIPLCQNGPGASCPMNEFKKIVEDGVDKYGDFHRVCGRK